MPLALDVAIAGRRRKRVRGHVENAVVKHVQNIEARKPAARVASTGFENRLKRFLPQMDGFNLEFTVGHFVKLKICSPVTLLNWKRSKPASGGLRSDSTVS